MRRRLDNVLLLSAWVLVIPAGCNRMPTNGPLVATPVSINLVLKLPDSVDPPKNFPQRVSRLIIDEKDFTEPRAATRSIRLDVPAGQESLKIEYSYWPKNYTNIIRTRVVTVGKEKSMDIDLTREDPSSPDLIKPIYLPTPDEVVEAMCTLGKVGPDDVVYDIGCGDGRLVILSVKKFGAKKGVGIDIDEHLVERSWENARQEGVANRVSFRAANALEIKDFSEASVVLLYLGDHLNQKLRPTLQKTLRSGTRVVSHRFKMGDWLPDESRTIFAKDLYGEKNKFELHLWTIR